MFISLGKFSATISSYSILVPFSSFWDYDTNVGSLVIVSNISSRLYSYFFFSLFSLCCSDWRISIVLSPSSLSFVRSILLLSPSAELLISIIVFLVLNFHKVFLYTLYFFAEAFHFLCFKCAHN